MKKYTLLVFTFLFLVSGVFAQSLDADLGKKFKKYKLAKINKNQLLRQISLIEPISLTNADGKHLQVYLVPKEIVKRGSRAEVMTSKGKEFLPDRPLTTFEGRIVGDPSSVLRFNIDGNKLEGYVINNDGMTYYGSAKKYSSHAKPDDTVIYKEEDLNNENPIPHDIHDKIAEGKNIAESAIKLQKTAPEYSVNSFTSTPMGVIELAVECDNQFVVAAGGAANTDTFIRETVNLADGVYRRDLNLSITITYSKYWVAPDPYSETVDAVALLNEFRIYWNNNNAAVQRDVAHFFTDRDGLDMNGTLVRGLAAGLLDCADKEYSIALSDFLHHPDTQFQTLAHEIGHNLSARHTQDSAPNDPDCNVSIMTTGGAGRTRFCGVSIAEITSFVSQYGWCIGVGTPPPPPPIVRVKQYDFSGDNKADLGVFNPFNGNWDIQPGSGGTTFQFGSYGDKLAAEDFDGDLKYDYAVFRPSVGDWFMQRSTQGFLGVHFGVAEDIPQPMDFDGDKKSELVVYRPSVGVWYVLNLVDNQFTGVGFGAPGDLPVVGDYDGDGKGDYAVYRPSNGTWYLLQSRDGFAVIPFGISTDKPVPADYDGDDKTDVAVYRGGVWHLQRSSLGYSYVILGDGDDIPLPADYDGDYKADVCIRDSDSGIHTRILTTNSATISTLLGGVDHLPVQAYKYR